MIMQMIGKLGEDKKPDWPSHLAEIVHVYKATHSTVMGYSPHYLFYFCQYASALNWACASCRVIHNLSKMEATYLPTCLAEASLVGASVLPMVGK